LNPRTWVLNDSTLPLDHRSRYKIDIFDKILPGHTKICPALWWGSISQRFSKTLTTRGPRVADHWCTHPSVAGFTTLNWYTKHYVQFNSDHYMKCLTDLHRIPVMHNHKFPSCTITNSVMHNHKHPSCTISDQNPSYIEGYLNILYHPNPHHDPDNMRLLYTCSCR